MVKRFLDVSLSLIALFVLAPILITIAVLIRVKLGSPIFFKQIRPGICAKPFEMIKFRTMTNDLDVNGDQLPDSARLTVFGQFLRSSSLDELPELWNVVMGDMSLVGPRPLLTEYVALYSEEQARRHSVRPGLSGWAQINGRNAISWEEKFKLDVWYVDNHSIWLDIKVIGLTLKKILARDGISSDGEVTVEYFKGNKTND
ncbi:sugar transferase [Amylibacter sp.]|nr:sugar transferase [Amylibacter sp.]